ncbi:MAG: hypothetical protein ACR2IE_02330 [Candidatus Sumerlaeaceae bacterium]
MTREHGGFPDDPEHNDSFEDDEDDDDEVLDRALPDIDQQIRINELKERARELAGGDLVEGKADTDLPPEIEEQFWQQVVAFESGDWVSGFDKLLSIGVDVPDPEELSDLELDEKLREIIGAMASIRTFLVHTDHLSDRELYERLWDDVLHEESPDMPMDKNGAWMIDLVSSGSDEDNDAYLRYYADEEYRQRWANDFPDEDIPPHEILPYNRDAKLPQPQDGDELDSRP